MIKNKYLLPNIGKLQNHLIGVKWFTKLDLRKTYNLVRIKEGDEWKTAFRIRYRIYKYQIISFGLTNAPAICQTLINDTLTECLDIYAVAYLNNIFIYLENLENHQGHVEDVLKRFLVRQLRYKSEKYEFHKKEMDFLRFIIRINGIKIDSEKIQKILDWPKPRNLKNFQEFLGFGNFNWQFISEYSLITLLLTELIKKDILFVWITFCEKIFNKFKKIFIIVSYFILFVSDKSVRIKTDISDKDIEAYLLQQGDEGV